MAVGVLFVRPAVAAAELKSLTLQEAVAMAENLDSEMVVACRCYVKVTATPVLVAILSSPGAEA